MFARNGRWSANQGLADGEGLAIPPGLVAPPSTVVEIDGIWDGDPGDVVGVLLGYLVDA